MSALQSRPAIQVAPVVFVTQTVVPVVLALAVLGEDLDATPLGGRPADRARCWRHLSPAPARWRARRCCWR